MINSKQPWNPWPSHSWAHITPPRPFNQVCGEKVTFFMWSTGQREIRARASPPLFLPRSSRPDRSCPWPSYSVGLQPGPQEDNEQRADAEREHGSFPGGRRRRREAASSGKASVFAARTPPVAMLGSPHPSRGRGFIERYLM